MTGKKKVSRVRISVILMKISHFFFILEYIKKICPYFDELHDIFGQKRSVHATSVIDSSLQSSNDMIDEFLEEEYLIDDDSDINELRVNSTAAISLSSQPSFVQPGPSRIVPPKFRSYTSSQLSMSRGVSLNEITHSNSVLNDITGSSTNEIDMTTEDATGDVEIQRSSSQPKRKRANGSLHVIMELQEKRLKLEEDKISKQFEIEKKKSRNFTN